ncbi:MAG: hypothetical protein K2W95_18765 [Candidatus Obscuribacterales bacterium]|nr:hypothetical protein [Candidatus Obscuribacterales bacterium]
MGNGRNLDDADGSERTEKPNEGQQSAEQLESAKVVDKINSEVGVGSTAGIEEQLAQVHASFRGREEDYNVDLQRETNGQFKSAHDMIRQTGELLCTDCMKQSIQDFLKSVGGTAGGFDFSGQIRQAVDQLTAAARQEAAARDGVPPGTAPGDTRIAAPAGQVPVEAAYPVAQAPGTGQPMGFMGDAPIAPPTTDEDVGAIEGGGPTASRPIEAPPAPIAKPVDAPREVTNATAPEAREGSDRLNQRGRPGANDTPEAVLARYETSVDNLRGLSQAQREEMKAAFRENMEKVKDKASCPEELARICKSMNDIMSSDKGMSQLSKLNTVVELSDKLATGRNPQGGHNTCAAASAEGAFQQKEPQGMAQYAELIARGCDSDTVHVAGRAVTIHPDNRNPDGESARPYDRRHTAAGQRSECGQIGQAIFAQQMCDIAGQRDGKSYTYIGTGQGGSTGEAMYETRNGQLVRKAECPPASIDVVACMHRVNGTGPLLVDAALARQFRPALEGVVACNGPEDYIRYSQQHPGKKIPMVIAGNVLNGDTNGAHGLHAVNLETQNVPGRGLVTTLHNQWGDRHTREIGTGRPGAMSTEFFGVATNFSGLGRNYQIQPGDIPPGSPSAVDNFRNGDDRFHQYMNEDKNKDNAKENEEKAKKALAEKDEKDRTELEKKYLDKYSRWQAELQAEQGRSPLNKQRLAELLAMQPRLT